MTGQHGENDVGYRVDAQAPDNAMADLVEVGAEQGCGAGPAEAPQAVVDQVVGDPASGRQGGQKQGVTPHQEAQSQAPDRAHVIPPAPDDAADQCRAELRRCGKRQQTKRRQAVVFPGHPVEAIGGQQNHKDRHPADTEQQVAEVGAAVHAGTEEFQQRRHDDFVADHGGDRYRADDNHCRGC